MAQLLHAAHPVARDEHRVRRAMVELSPGVGAFGDAPTEEAAVEAWRCAEVGPPRQPWPAPDGPTGGWR